MSRPASASHETRKETHPKAPELDQDHKLGEFASTAICGNDITSSCLYVSALAIGAAGKMAPIGLLIVAALLYLFRKIYAEVVGALPLNGGAYNALLNTTSKSRASIAACLTILSYMATAVISAGEAMHYLHILWAGLDVFWATVVLLGIFTCLTVMGISESAQVAIMIFVTHLVTLAILLLCGVAYVFGSESGREVLTANLSAPLSIHVPADDDGSLDASLEATPAARGESERRSRVGGRT